MLIIQGSPRPGGVTDALALAMCQSIGPDSCRMLAVRDYKFAPCVGCNNCAITGKCKLDKNANHDQAREIFAAILGANSLLIVSPIYFYALPGMLKCLIDRCQVYWHTPLTRSSRPAAVILAAAREHGQQLFTGSLLTLRYFLLPLAYHLHRSICFRGLENLDSLRTHPEYIIQAQTLAQEMAH